MREHDDMTTQVGLEPIAIVGIGCRFPGGAEDPDAFWTLLREGVDAISEVPPDRWNADAFYNPNREHPGTAVTRWGGFVRQPVSEFDALFFGMSPREAAHLDPMQRWLLELTWEALEDAGIPPGHLAGTATGVFVGVFTEDTKLFQLGDSNRDLIGPHTGTGTAMTMAANRISYWYDLRGPSISLDTACSSSLIAVHLACESLRRGESTVALAGGANAMFRPEYTIAESKAGMLSPDGRCKTFDASANGYVRGEGAGIVVLKPLSAARRDGDRIHALILGTATNQDGRTQGITVPNGEAQQDLMREAFRRSGVSPGRVRYMEAHGTGTPVGDPIEAEALARVLAEGRPAGDRCLVGSVKTNIGHLEAAAGVAGLIKAALTLERREIPPHLHLQNPNPAIPFDDLCLRVPRSLEPWPDEPGPALAAVNSFGFGGANAHAVLAEAPATDPSRKIAEDDRAELIPLSARSPEALRELAASYVDRLAGTAATLPLRHVAWTAATRRTHHEHRLSVVAHDPNQLREGLQAFLDGEGSSGLRHGTAGPNGRLAWIFSGMGPQWWAMGRQLLDQEPVFRAVIEQCDALLRRHANWSLLDEMTAEEDRSRMAETQISQPANFALQAGLVTLFRSWGIEPDAIAGHSTGEAAAFWAAGVVGLDEAVRIIYHRSRLQHLTSGQGKLVAVGESHEALKPFVAGVDGVSIAAVNSPSSVTLAGDPAALESLVEPLQERGVFCRFLRVDVPFHSHYMEPLKGELLECLAGLELRNAGVPLYSTVTASRASGPELDAHYWWRNVREPVLFAATIDRLAADGYDTFLEIGPHPVVGGSITECLRQRGADGLVLSTLRRKTEERAALLDSLGALFAVGRPVDWAGLHPDGGRLADLPLYPWQRERHWDESPQSIRDRLEEPAHPLLGKRLSTARPEWHGRVDEASVPYLADHRILGGVVFPGAAYVEMGVAAVREVVDREAAIELDEIRFDRAMFLPDDEARVVQTTFDPETLRFDVFSRPLDDETWLHHAGGRLVRARRSARPLPATDLETVRARGTIEIAHDECYARLLARGYSYGPRFQRIDRAWLLDGEAVARLAGAPPPTEADRHHLHPTLLDAAFQALLLAGLDDGGNGSDGGDGATYLPVSIDRLVLHGPTHQAAWVHGRLTRRDDEVLEGEARICDESGSLLAVAEGVHSRSLDAVEERDQPTERLFFTVGWETAPEAAETEEAPSARSVTWLLFGDQGGVADAMAERLAAGGASCAMVRVGDDYRRDPDGWTWWIDPGRPEHLDRLLADLAATALPPCRGMLHLWSLDSPSTEALDAGSLLAAQTPGPVALLHTLQALDRAGWGERPRLWIVTRGAQATGGEGEPVAVAQSAMWGFARTIFHQESTDLAGGIVDLDPAAPDDELDRLAATIQCPGREDQLAFRGGSVLVPRLRAAADLAGGFVPPRFRPDGTVLITGGLGGLGLLFARWLVDRGARHLVLTGRTPLPPRSEWDATPPGTRDAERIAAVRKLEASGATIRVVACDAADAAALDRTLSELRSDRWPPVRGVLHAAGVAQPLLLLQMGTEEFTAALRPKLAGAWLLHDRLKDEPLDFFVLFSSVAALGFSMGMSNYAAGNAFLDGLAAYRRASGQPVNSIAWGAWGEVGMASPEEVASAFVRRGFVLIHPEQGLEAMERVFEHDPDQVVVLGADWQKIPAGNYPAGAPPFLRDVVEALQIDDGAGDGDGPSDVRARLAAAAEEDRGPILAAHLAELAGRVLRIDSSRLEPGISLDSYGLDSMLAVELRNRIEPTLGAGPSIVELLQGISISELADLLLPRIDLAPTGEDVDELVARLGDVSAEELDALLESGR